MDSAIRLGDLPGAAAEKWGDFEAVCYGTTRISFNELGKQVDLAARALLARGIGRGDVVGLWVTNRPEFMIALFAILKVGAIAAPMNTRYREQDLAYALQLAECKLLFVVERSGPVVFLDILKAVLPDFNGKFFRDAENFPHLREVVVVGDTQGNDSISWKTFLESAIKESPGRLRDRAAAVSPKDAALLIFTSGTTGNPKAVIQSHSILANLRERHESWPLQAGDAVLSFLPMFHAYGMTDNVFAAFCIGERQVIMESWDPELAVELIEREKIAGLHGFETHYADIMRVQETRKADFSSLRFGTLPAGMENSNAVALKVQDAICPTVSGFGMSEIGCFVCMSSLSDTKEQRCTTSGKPMQGVEVKVVDPATGEEQPNGIEGELLFRGYTLMRGYFRDPEATAKAIDGEGWLHSGDRGFLRSDGFLQFLGRYKEMLKVGGENVSPAALEQALLDLVPSIASVAVVGVPDDRLIEVPAAYVVTKPGMRCTLEEVTKGCKGKIASFKIPHHVFEIDSLPMTASGKVQRTLLKEQALCKLEHDAQKI